MSGSFLVGEKVHLQIPDIRHLDLLYEWYNDDVATRLMFTGTFPIDRDTAAKNFLDMVYSLNDVVLGIFAKESADTTVHWFVGTIGLHSVNWVVGSAEFRIFLGNTAFWGKGLGTEATQLIVDYGFDRMGLNVIWLGVNTENKAAKRIYDKVGFKEDGLLRRVQYRNGRYYDAYRMSLLREEWECIQQQ